MASEDNYKEGVDFVWVDKDGYKTRKFLTRAEKAAKNAPAPKAAPKADKPKGTTPRPKKRPADLAAPKGGSNTKVAGRPSTPVGGGMPKAPAKASPNRAGEDARAKVAASKEQVRLAKDATDKRRQVELERRKKDDSKSINTALAVGAGIAATAAAAGIASKGLKGRGTESVTGFKARTLTEAKPTPKPTGTTTTPREDRISREIKVRNEATARAAKANATADKNIQAKANKVAEVKAAAKTRSELARANVDNSYSRRAESAKAARTEAENRLKIQRNFANATRPKFSQDSRGSGGRAGGMSMSTDPMFTALGGGGFGMLEASKPGPFDYAKGGLVPKKKK